MDSLLSTAARALAVGDPLKALKHVALLSDGPALALRGIAMAQLGDFTRARSLLQRASRAFGPGEPVARARCVTAQAELALASHDLATAHRGLEAAADVLDAHGDRANAMFARLVNIRRLVLLSRLDAAEHALVELSLEQVPERLVAVAELVAADIATRRLRTLDARAALHRAQKAAQVAGIPPLAAEVERALRQFEAPAARLWVGEEATPVSLEQVKGVLDSGELVVDGCRREIRAGSVAVSFVRRPVLFALALALAERAPEEVPRETLIWRAFATRRANDSHRARLRVEVGRVRKALGKLAELRATANGFALVPARGRHALLLLPPGPGEASELVALLSSGDSWSTSALSMALGKSQRSVQRALGTLEQLGKVSAIGRGRAQRWVATPSTGFATTLLLVARGALG